MYWRITEKIVNCQLAMCSLGKELKTFWGMRWFGDFSCDNTDDCPWVYATYIWDIGFKEKAFSEKDPSGCWKNCWVGGFKVFSSTYFGVFASKSHRVESPVFRWALLLSWPPHSPETIGGQWFCFLDGTCQQFLFEKNASKWLSNQHIIQNGVLLSVLKELEWERWEPFRERERETNHLSQ